MEIGVGVGESIHCVFLVVLSFLSAGLLAATRSTRPAGKVVVSRRSIYLLVVVAAC